MRGWYLWTVMAAALCVGTTDRPPRVSVGKVVEGAGFRIELVAKIQAYAPATTGAIYDPDLISPKQVGFHPSGKVYINAMFGSVTLVYDARTRQRIAAIPHQFGPSHQGLFADALLPGYAFLRPQPHIFWGYPVEMAFSHGSRYLWIPYYRRSYDTNGLGPSAIALVDTARDAIVRLFSCGPIPKMIAVSPEGKYLAVIHWGDNTVGLMDIQGDDPTVFRWVHHVVVESVFRPVVQKGEKIDRDRVCGLCLRGAAFSPDGRYLMVGRMHSGGVAVIDVEGGRYLGTLWGIPDTPRHLVLDADGRWLYISSSLSGMVSRVAWEPLVQAAKTGQAHISVDRAVRVGRGVRTIALSPDGRFLYGAVHHEARLVVLRTDTLEPVVSIPTDPYPVGLAVSPDGQEVWVTTQGRKGYGGHSVLIYRVQAQGSL